MQTTFKICKLFLLLCLGLSTNGSPILTGLKTVPSLSQQSGSSFHHEYSYSSNPGYNNFEIQPNVQSTLAVDQSLKNIPGVTTTFRDQNGNLVTQVKKETVNNNNGQNAHVLEFEETKQLPNGYAKSFKKEYSSSSAIQSLPTTFIQKPLTVDKYYNSEKSINGETSQFGQYYQNYQGSLLSGNSDNFGINSNLKPTIGESKTNVPAVTSAFRDQNGNLVTMVKKETVNNNNGQNTHVLEFEETKQLPNGYAKSFKKEYSSSSAIQSLPTTFIQKPLTVDKYYNNEKSINGETSQFGQYYQNYQGSLLSGNSDNFGINSNLKPTIGESKTNVPAVTSAFRDQNGNLVTMVKKETVNNNNGQNTHVLEFEETKQLPNGYAKSFKKEFSSSSVIGSYPTYTEIPTSMPQKLTSGKIENFDGYNTFFNNQKQPLNPNGPINSQIINDKKTAYHTHDINKANSFGYKDQIDCENENSSSSYQTFKQEPVNLNTYPKPSFVDQHSVNINLAQNVGQESVDLHEFSKPSAVGQESVNIDNVYNPKKQEKKINGEQFEKLESFSSQTQHFGQESVDLHDFSKSSPVGQESVNIDNIYTPNKPEMKPTGLQFEKLESSYQNKYSSVGQRPVNINENDKLNQQYNKGQQIISQPTTGQQIQGLEFLNSNYRDTTHLVDLGVNGQQHSEYTRGSQSGQQNVNNEKPLPLSKPNNQKAFSAYTHNTGQESVDLHDFSKSSSIGQESVNIDSQYKPNVKPTGQYQNEKFEFSSTQTQNVGQESVDLHEFSKPSAVGQESVNIDNVYNPKKQEKKINGEQFEKLESFSSQTQHFGQESVDLHDFSKSSPVGQESVNIDNIYTPNKPEMKPTGLQFEKLESSYQNKYSSVGQRPVNINENDKLNQQYNKGQQIISQPTTGQQIQGLEFLNSNYRDTTHLVDLGVNGQQHTEYTRGSQSGQQNVNNEKPLPLSKPNNQKAFSAYTHNTGQESVDLHDFSKSSSIGQESVNIDSQYKPNVKPTGQYQNEKFEFSSTQTQNVGQESVDLHEFSKPSPVGQESVTIDNFYTPNKPEIKPTGLQFEKLESSNQNKYSSVGQRPVNINKNDKLNQQYNKGQQIISQPTTGQQIQGLEFLNSNYRDTTHLVDLGVNGQQHTEYTRGSQSGQQNVNNEKPLPLSKPNNQKAFSAYTHNTGQESVDLHDFSKSSSIGQESVNIDSQYKPNVKPTGQYQNEKFEFSSTQTQNVGQESVDLHEFSKPSPVGQESVTIDNFYTPNKPEIKPTGLQFEKLESSYQNKYSSVGQRPVNINKNDKLNQQYNKGQQIISQPTTGQQIQGLEFLNSNYRDTTHLVDLGVNGQQHTEYTRGSQSGQQNVNNEKLLQLSKPNGQQAVVFVQHSTIEKNIDLSSLENLPTNINSYQSIHEQSMKSPALQGQQTIDLTSNFEGNKPTYQKHYGNDDFQKSDFSSQTGKLNTGKEQSINFKYNSVFDKLGQLEHEILAPKSTVNINKDNFQTSYSTNHDVKSMPQMSQQVSSFSRTINENTQYIEPQSETFSSSLSKKETESIVQQDTIENHEHFMENPTTQPSVWKKFGNKVKGTIQNAKNKAQQLASTINEKVGFSKNNDTENPC